jgi:hypothetical protein
MSLLGLLNKRNKNPLAPPPNQETYEEYVFEMEKNHTNDLVERNNVDFTFRPPASTTKYQETIFREQAAGNA